MLADGDRVKELAIIGREKLKREKTKGDRLLSLPFHHFFQSSSSQENKLLLDYQFSELDW